MSEPLTGRLFLALWPNPAVRRQLAEWQSGCVWPPAARVVPTRDLHLTLHFIGPIPSSRFDEVAAGLSVSPPEISVVIDTFACWHGGLSVLLPSQNAIELADLHASLTDRLRTLRLPIERRIYKPHVTLARRSVGAKASNPAPNPVPWRTQGYVLAARQGSSYQILRPFGSVEAS